MADESKTEKATPRKRQKAREEGNIARSKDLNTFMSLASFATVLFALGPWFVRTSVEDMRMLFSLAAQEISMQSFLLAAGKEAGKVLLYFVLVIGAFQTLDHFVQTRFIVAWKLLKPDFGKINPLNGNYFRRIFSLKTVVDLAKSFALVGLVGAVGYLTLKGKVGDIAGAITVSWLGSLTMFWGLFKTVMIRLLCLLFAIAAADYAYQKWDYNRRMRMSKQEVRDEQKETMGNPQIKERIRKTAIAMLRQKARVLVPEAHFVVVNPTHYSVAVRWKRGEDPVPRVLVKGVDEVALFMREIAKENSVPIVENPPLARELYAKVDADEFIPEELFLAVSSVLRYLRDTKQISFD